VGNGSAPSNGAPHAAPSNGNGYGRSPEVQARIERQHSQHMFLLYCKVKGAVPGTTEEIRAGIDWWQRDIAHAPVTPTSATTAPMPEATTEDPGLDLK
jgi:hypothetical protein